MAESEALDPPRFVPDPPLAAQLESARGHPGMACFEGIGGSGWPDDFPIHPLLLYRCVCRFRSGDEAAYVWFERGHWWVRPWLPLRRLSLRWERFGSLAAALDCLVAPAPAARRRWWWK